SGRASCSLPGSARWRPTTSARSPARPRRTTTSTWSASRCNGDPAGQVHPGKSHLLKVLSYLLRNRTHALDGQQKPAVDCFRSKVQAAVFFGDIQRAVASTADVVLFNIDSKADHRTRRDLILRVFLKVLNELQGYSSTHPGTLS